jgi:hypothetical protein
MQWWFAATVTACALPTRAVAQPGVPITTRPAPSPPTPPPSLYDQCGEFVRADNGAFVGPRVGFDVGGAIRFRFALELYWQFTDRTRSTGERIGSFRTFGMTLGLGYQR